ncbi:MAG: prepilin peptidase [Candidatus Brocadiae bacterium]|nr:prepilin peptidase [Candidatus Brocadiia bacterium]
MYPDPLVQLFTVFAGLFGAVVGSFLNVCIYRLPRGYVSIVFPGSHCTQCGTMLKWYDNIPIFSWLSLGGACRYCKTIIHSRYLWIEILTACLFIFYVRNIALVPLPFFEALPMAKQIFALAVAIYLVCLMVVITFIDIDYRIIPDCITYPGIILAPFLSALCPVYHPQIQSLSDPYLSGLLSSLLGVFVGGGSLYGVGVIGKAIFGKDAMGLGDVKMMALVGGFLGWDSALIIFLLACILGTFIGIFSLILTKDHYIPFGPYLAAGTLVTLLFKEDILHLSFHVWPQIVSKWLGIFGYNYGY